MVRFSANGLVLDRLWNVLHADSIAEARSSATITKRCAVEYSGWHVTRMTCGLFDLLSKVERSTEGETMVLRVTENYSFSPVRNVTSTSSPILTPSRFRKGLPKPVL